MVMFYSEAAESLDELLWSNRTASSGKKCMQLRLHDGVYYLLNTDQRNIH